MPTLERTPPNHVGIILDGNGRWATRRGLERSRGHEEGTKVAAWAVQACRERGIKNLTLYTFSAANWSRPKAEIDTLMRLVREFCESQRSAFLEHGIQALAIGDLEELPTGTRRAVERLVEDTSEGAGMKVALAVNYGGRRDMVSAMRAVAIHARAGLLIPEEITEGSLRTFLTTGAMPDPDLIIRTGGERRLSDFLLFEAAYAELFFTETLWPDFDAATLDEALDAFSRRRRRSRRAEMPLAAAG